MTTKIRGKYAATTKVAIAVSRDELERVLTKCGATQFMYGATEYQWLLAFRYDGRNYKIVVDRPDQEDFRYQDQIDQAERQIWRALILVIKGKLEAVDMGFEPFEGAFLSHLMLPDGSTVGENIGPAVEEMYDSGQMSSLLPGMVGMRGLPDGR